MVGILARGCRLWVCGRWFRESADSQLQPFNCRIYLCWRIFLDLLVVVVRHQRIQRKTKCASRRGAISISSMIGIWLPSASNNSSIPRAFNVPNPRVTCDAVELATLQILESRVLLMLVRVCDFPKFQILRSQCPRNSLSRDSFVPLTRTVSQLVAVFHSVLCWSQAF
jgi:hypothetical protein